MQKKNLTEEMLIEIGDSIPKPQSAKIRKVWFLNALSLMVSARRATELGIKLLAREFYFMQRMTFFEFRIHKGLIINIIRYSSTGNV